MKKKFVDTVNLHNEFVFEIRDSRTGELKQTAKAYNILLNGAFDRLCDMIGLSNVESSTFNPTRKVGHRVMGPPDENSDYLSYGQDRRIGPYIFIGTGTGELASTRTTLFEYESGKLAVYYDHGYNFDTQVGYHTKVATWEAGELTGETITEVGLSARSASGYLSSHALIEDSEGDPISITMGEYDVLTVYSTVYVELSSDYDGLHFDNAGQIPQLAALFVLNGSFCMDSNTQTYALVHKVISGASNADRGANTQDVDNYLDSVSNTPTITITKASKKIDFSMRVNAGELNTAEGMREFAISRYRGTSWEVETPVANYRVGGGWLPIFRCALPVSGVFEETNIVAEEVGTGDGATDEFNLLWNSFILDSEVIKVDGTTKTRGTHYTVNSGVGNASGKDNVLQFAKVSSDSQSLLPSSSQATYFARNVVNSGGSFYISGLTQGAGNTLNEQPDIVFDTGSAHTVSTFKLYQGSTSNARVANFKLQGSNDGSSWTDIVSDTLQSTIGWDEFNFDPATYRYFRFIALSSGGSTTAIYIYEMQLPSDMPHITFTTGNIPAEGEAITADYDLAYIGKDSNHVLDIEYTIQFGDGNAV